MSIIYRLEIEPSLWDDIDSGTKHGDDGWEWISVSTTQKLILWRDTLNSKIYRPLGKGGKSMSPKSVTRTTLTFGRLIPKLENSTVEWDGTYRSEEDIPERTDKNVPYGRTREQQEVSQGWELITCLPVYRSQNTYSRGTISTTSNKHDPDYVDTRSTHDVIDETTDLLRYKSCRKWQEV